MSDISFEEWLKRQRKAAGLTQEKLAEQLHCSTITLRKIEAGERLPSTQIAESLANFFNIPKDQKKEFIKFARGNTELAYQVTPHLPWSPTEKQPHINLPSTVTSIVGRDNEVKTLLRYLADPNIRIITLMGPPGIGKTRLSIETARMALPNFRDGVFFVPLSSLESPAMIAPAISQSLGFVETSDQSFLNRLTSGIGTQQMLIVLDNCEHLIEDAAPLASALLSACPHLKIITTSRESLRIPGEWLYNVPVLATPSPASAMDMDSTSQFPALSLFEERARAVRSDFKLTDDNLQAVASICSQLDGLPLAIELIATRIRLMSPQSLLEHMTDSFILSADGMRAVSARQKTLNNAIGWSYNSLTDEEKKLFNLLAVFSGGFSLETAEGAFAKILEGTSISQLLISLSDKSLIQRSQDQWGGVRFNMLVTVQQFAINQLRNSGLEEEARNAHLLFFLTYAEKGEKELRGPQQDIWFDRFENEYSNFHQALNWSVEKQKTETALRLLLALGWPWEVRAHYYEARNWIEKIRTLPDYKDYPIPYSRILNHIGRYFWTENNYSEARALLTESMEITSQLGSDGELSLAEASNWFGLLVYFNDGEGDEAGIRTHLQRGLSLYEHLNNRWGMALTKFHFGILENSVRHYELAAALLEDSLSVFEEFGDLFFIGRVSIQLGFLSLNKGDFKKAQEYFEEHLRIDTQLHFWSGLADAWINLGHLHRQLKDETQATECFTQARLVAREHGVTKEFPEQPATAENI